MDFKRLISPKFRIVAGQYEITSGMEVECFSSREARSDWCKVELSTQLQGAMEYQDLDRAIVELGYDGDYDLLLSGYIRKVSGDYWKEIMIRDDMMRLERLDLVVTFQQCTPQDIIRYILSQAGITDYELSESDYGKMDVFIVNRKNGVKAISELNSRWGLNNDFFFVNHRFYWGCRPEQENVYVLEEGINILSMEKYGGTWEIETFGVPWIHHSQYIQVEHSKYSGLVIVEKTIVKSDARGRTRMYIYFGGE